MSALSRLQNQMEGGRLAYAQKIADRPSPTQGGGVSAGYNAATASQLIASPSGKILAVKTVSNGGVRTGTPQNYNLPKGTLPRTDTMPR